MVKIHKFFENEFEKKTFFKKQNLIGGKGITNRYQKVKCLNIKFVKFVKFVKKKKQISKLKRYLKIEVMFGHDII